MSRNWNVAQLGGRAIEMSRKENVAQMDVAQMGCRGRKKSRKWHFPHPVHVVLFHKRHCGRIAYNPLLTRNVVKTDSS